MSITEEQKRDLIANHKAFHARLKAARDALGGKPGAVDVTWAKVGDRVGYVITVDPSEAIEIVVRSSAVKCEVYARYDGCHAFGTNTGNFPEEDGVSEYGALGLTVERADLREGLAWRERGLGPSVFDPEGSPPIR